MIKKNSYLIFFLLPFLFGGLSFGKPRPPFSEKIAWYISPDLAFKKAHKLQRRLFLYWGAKWCPPCIVFKKKVLSQESVQRKLSSFISVYIDGDSKEASKWSDKLKVKGYPTLLILSSKGEELMRPLASNSPQQFLDLLGKIEEKDLNLLENISRLNQVPLNDADLNLLANHSWNQDPNSLSTVSSPAQFFHSLMEKVSPENKELKTRFFILYFKFLLKEDPNSKELAMAWKKVGKVLKNRKYVLNDFNFFIYELPRYLFGKLAPSPQLREGLINALLKQSDSFQKDKFLSLKKRIGSIYPDTYIFFSNHSGSSKVSQANLSSYNILKERTHDLLKEFRNSKSEGEKRYGQASSLIWILLETRQLEKAFQLGMESLNNSPHPYYIMSYLSKIEEKRGNKQEALKWLEKAKSLAIGDATVLQWEIQYLIGLLKYEEASKESFLNYWAKKTYLFQKKEVFLGRNFVQIKKLLKFLGKRKNLKLSKEIRNQLSSQCRKFQDIGISKNCKEI